MEAQFVFKGFRPDEETVFRCNSRLSSFVERAPSDSAVSSLIKLNHGLYSGRVAVVSSEGCFTATSTNPDLDLLISELFSKIGRRLDHWRATRFDDQIDSVDGVEPDEIDLYLSDVFWSDPPVKVRGH